MDRRNEGGADNLPCTSRRAFCAELLTTGLILAAAPGVAKASAVQDSTVAYPPRKIEGAELLLPGSSLYFNYPTRNDPAVLLRFSESEYSAYSRRCSHAGCSVDFDPRSRYLICPCHRGTYDSRMGRAMFGPPRQPLDEIVLEIRAGGYIWAVGKNQRNPDMITKNLRGGD